MSSCIRFALSVALLSLLAAPFAQARDASVEKRLDERGIAYEITPRGDYTVVVSFGTGNAKRTHLVYVSGETESVRGFTIRKVYARAAAMADVVAGDKALRLLGMNHRAKLGAWELADMLYFVIKLPDDVDAMRLQKAIEIAGSEADDMELEISGDRDAF